MPEPITHTISGAALAVPVAAAASTLFGIEYAAIGWAFIGGCLSLIWMPRFEFWWQALVSVASSTVIGSSLGQWSAAPVLLTIKHFAPWLEPWAASSQSTATCFMALLIGLCAQKVLPGLLKRAGLLSEGKHDPVL